MDMHNILILSAGRRVELVTCFQIAARNLNIESKVIAGDCTKTAPALYVADKAVLLPRINNPGYIDSIIEVCNSEKVSLIIPTIDTDLLLLAENRYRIEIEGNCKLLISDVNVIKICRDKIKTHEFMVANNFKVPQLYDKNELNGNNNVYPLFIKPKSGSSSINAFKVSSRQDLDNYLSMIDSPIIQEFIEGDEYTVDVFLDFEGNIITIVPRLRIATRSGEISKGRIVKDREIIDEIKNMMAALKPIGHITVQLMKTVKGIFYIEINPRFGGGAPMSIKSGADSCENLYRILMGQKLTYNENYRENITFLRFDSSICIDDNKEIVTW